MTENEAIKELSYDNTAYGGRCTEEVRRVAIHALSEIQQYRAIGTVESLKNLPAICDSLAESSKKAEKLIEELQAYRAIGTIEEFKALKEKNEPKRLLTKWEMYPTNHGVYSSADRWCPSCKNLVFDGDWSISKQKMMYNRHRCECGQVLDWQ